MMKSVQRALAFGLLVSLSGLAAAQVMLKDGHPGKYFVKNGDTLWDISARFLEEPWQWPEIWQINEEIRNPHLIYPGDEIRLTYVNGEPRLSVKRGVEEKTLPNGTVKLTPKVREIANDEAIPAIPAGAIAAYLKEGLVVSREEIAEAPYIVGGRDRRVIFGEGDTVYARDVKDEWADLQRGYGFYRVGEQYVDPDTNEVLGYEARQIGLGRVADHDEDMLTLRVTRSSEDLRIDDRLFSTEDRRVRSARVPITAKVVADMITAVGIDRVVTVDLHADQIQGFFDIPVDNVYATPLIVADIERQNHDDLMVVSPDVGGVVRARALAKQLNDADLAIIDKRRPKANISQVMHIIGEVEGRTCILVDDMVDTAGTLCHAAKALKDHGAAQVYAYCTHPILSGKAIENITGSVLDELVVTNTIPLTPAAEACERIRQLDMAPIVAEAMRRISNEESISAMFR